MSLLDEVAGYTQKPGFKCGIHVWLTQNPEYTTADLREAAEAHTAAAVWRFMKDKGFTGAQLSLTRHLRGDCQCR